MSLKPEISIPVALATAGLVYGVYAYSLPSLADTRVSPANEENLAKVESNAAWLSIAAISGVSLLSRDPVPFIFGGLTLVALSWSHRFQRATDASDGKIAFNPKRLQVVS